MNKTTRKELCEHWPDVFMMNYVFDKVKVQTGRGHVLMSWQLQQMVLREIKHNKALRN